MRVIIDTTFSGPLKARLLGTRWDTFFKQKVAVVEATESSANNAYHKGEFLEVPLYDVFTGVIRSGIASITYHGRVKWDDVPYLGTIEYRAPTCSPFERRYAKIRVTPMRPTYDSQKPQRAA